MLSIIFTAFDIYSVMNESTSENIYKKSVILLAEVVVLLDQFNKQYNYVEIN